MDLDSSSCDDGDEDDSLGLDGDDMKAVTTVVREERRRPEASPARERGPDGGMTGSLPSESSAAMPRVPCDRSCVSAKSADAANAVVLVQRPNGDMLVRPAEGFVIAPVYDDASGALMGAQLVPADGANATAEDEDDDDASIPSTPAISTVDDDDTEFGERASITINDFMCPITKELPTNPVMLRGDGRFYERDSIVAWLQEHNRSPVTNFELTPEGRQLIESSGISSLFESLNILTVNAKKLAAAARSYKFAAKLSQRSICTPQGNRRSGGGNGGGRSRSKRYTSKEFKKGWREMGDLDRAAFRSWRRTLFPRDDDRLRPTLFVNLGSDAERWAFHQILPRVLDENPRARAMLRKLVFWWGGTDDQRVLAAACVETLVVARQVPSLRKVRFWDVGQHVRRDIIAELRESFDRGLLIKFASKLSDARRE